MISRMGKFCGILPVSNQPPISITSCMQLAIKKIDQMEPGCSLIDLIYDIRDTLESCFSLKVDDVKQLKKMRAEGKSTREIGTHFNCDHKTVETAMKRFGYENFPKPKKISKSIFPKQKKEIVVVESPIIELKKITRTIRMCLSCEKDFKSFGPQNRQCMSCRDKKIW